jgi:voltage-gated sodium channel
MSSRTADSLMAILPTPAKEISSALEQELERIEWAEALLQGDGSFKLNIFGGVVVLLNAIVFAVQTDCGGRDEDGHLTWTWPWFIVDSLFCIAYLFEIALRLRRFGCQWLCNPANAADVAIVSANVLDTWVLSMLSVSSNVSMLTILRLLRLIRLVRLMRLIKFFRAFYAVVVAFKHAMSSIVWIGGLLAFGLFLVSLFTTNFIGHGATFANVNMGGLSANDRFGTLFRSMFSNFELMTLEGWSDTWRPIVEAEPLMFAYLVLFIMVFTFGLLNMIVAMVVEKTIFESKKLEEIDEAADYRRMRTAIERMVEAFEEADGNSDGKITLSEFEAAVEKSTVVREALEFLNLPLEDARGLFLMLDINRSGELTIDEFSEGCEKVSGSTPTQRDIIATHAEVRNISRILQKVNRNVRKSSAEPLEDMVMLKKDSEEREPSNGSVPAVRENLPGSISQESTDCRSLSDLDSEADIRSRLDALEKESRRQTQILLEIQNALTGSKPASDEIRQLT